MNKVKYLLVQTAVGDYRDAALKLVCDKLRRDFLLLSGEEYFESSTVTRVDLGLNQKTISNKFLFGRRFLWQSGSIRQTITSDVVILELNPRIINVWIALIVRRMLGKKTILWGHAWPRAGRNAKSDAIRNFMRRLATHIIVYTDTQKKELSLKMPFASISSAPNSLYSSNDMWVPSNERKNFVYVGRLIESKKPALMIEAYSLAVASQDLGDLVIVGDGPARQFCESLVLDLGIENKVRFLGHLADVSVLRELYSFSVASLSPGYVGLSITQSFSFGTPMIAADDEPHAPEIEAAVVNENCIFFKAGDPQSMANSMLTLWDDKDEWSAKSLVIIEDCKLRYSAETMAQRIIEAFEK